MKFTLDSVRLEADWLGLHSPCIASSWTELSLLMSYWLELNILTLPVGCTRWSFQLLWILSSVDSSPRWLPAIAFPWGSIKTWITYWPLQSAAIIDMFHWNISSWKPLESPVVAMCLKVGVTSPPKRVHTQGESITSDLLCLLWSFLLLVGFSSCFRSYQGPWDSLFSFSSSYCCTAVSGPQISERVFVCCSPLRHFHESPEFQTHFPM